MICALVHRHAGRGRGQLQTVSTKLGGWNYPKCLGMLKYSQVSSLEPRGGNNPTIVLPPPNFTLGTTGSDVYRSWQPPNPNSSIKLPETLVTPANASPCLQSPVAAYISPLHPTLCIELGDVWPGCSCSAMETPSMKLSAHRS